jgi:hypothetical protein
MAGVTYYEQDSDDDADQYDEWRGILSIAYTLFSTK